MTSIDDLNYAKNLVLAKIRDEMVKRRADVCERIDLHLREYVHKGDPNYTDLDNKIWAVKDAKLSAESVELWHFINRLNKEMEN